MSQRVTLNEAQIALLRQLAAGCCISYSQDGEDGWLYPPSSRRVRGRLNDDDIWALRDAGFIAKDEEPDGFARFRVATTSPPPAAPISPP